MASTETSTVVRLPTAAPRKVRHPQTRAEREAAERHPIRFPEKRSRYAQAPWMRKALEQAKLMDACTQTPEFALALAMFLSLDKGDKAKVEAFLTIMKIRDGGSTAASNALAWVRFQSADGEEKADIARALDAYRNGEAE